MKEKAIQPFIRVRIPRNTFDYSGIDNVFDWLKDRFGPYGERWGLDFFPGGLTMLFNNESDAVTFKLSWGDAFPTISELG